jgi:hypothetical protein
VGPGLAGIGWAAVAARLAEFPNHGMLRCEEIADRFFLCPFGHEVLQEIMERLMERFIDPARNNAAQFRTFDGRFPASS